MEQLLLNSFRKMCMTKNIIQNKAAEYTLINKRFNSTIQNSLRFNLINRNPRNLERLRIARKPTGYHLDKPGKTFWCKVSLIQKPRYVIAQVCHNNGNVIVQASTNEWSLSKHLYRCNDKNAYVSLAFVLAERCLQSGINEMINGVDCNSNKRKEFIKCIEEYGISLSESPTYKPLTPWSRTIYEKPWKIHNVC